MPPKRKALSEAPTNASNSQPRPRATKTAKTSKTSTASKSTTKNTKTSQASTASKSTANMSVPAIKYCNADTLSKDMPDYTNLQWPNIADFKNDKNQDMPADAKGFRQRYLYENNESIQEIRNVEGSAAFVTAADLTEFVGNEDGDSVKDVAEYLGVMILTTYDMLKEHDLLVPHSPESKIKNLETVALILIEFLVEWGEDLDCNCACEIFRCFDEAGTDLRKLSGDKSRCLRSRLRNFERNTRRRWKRVNTLSLRITGTGTQHLRRTPNGSQRMIRMSMRGKFSIGGIGKSSIRISKITIREGNTTISRK